MKPISRRMKQVNREKDGKPVDISQLRQPITLGGSTLNQVLNAVHYGSPEMRALLQVECNFIFECKVCRSLFRDFPNFISHKRVFCQKSALEEQWINLANITEEEVVMMEPEAPEETASQGPEDPTSVTAASGQDHPTGENVEQANPSVEGTSPLEQPESSDLGVVEKAVTQNEQLCEIPSTDAVTNQPSSISDPGVDNHPVPLEKEPSRNPEQVKSSQMGKNGRGPRLSLEDTVQRLQAKNSDQSYSLRVYAKAAEKIERQKENTKVTTIKTTSIATNSNAVFVDFSTRTRQRGETDPVDETEVEGISTTSKEDNFQGEGSLHKRSEDYQKSSRRKGLVSSRKETSESLQDSKNDAERKQSKRKEGDLKTSKREERQKFGQKKEHDPQIQRRQLRGSSQYENKPDFRKSNEVSENLSPLRGSSLRSRFTHYVPKELIRVGKPRTIYPEPQQLLMDQLREMQDKVKQKAAAEGKAEPLQLSDEDGYDDDEDGHDNDDNGTEEIPQLNLLSPASEDERKVSLALTRSPSQRSGVYKCRMCIYEAEDKADCIKHIMRKHRYAMRHKSAVAIRSMAVYQSSSKKQGKTNKNEDEDQSDSQCTEITSEDGNRLHDIVRKNLQFALQKAEEVLKSRQNTGPQKTIKLREAQKKQVEKETHPLMCHKCNKVYSSKATLNFHESVHHSETRTYFPCTRCKKVFASLQGLQRHLRTLHGMSGEKVIQIREKLKKKAFTKHISQSQIQRSSETSPDVKPAVQKRPLEESRDNLHVRPAKRQRLNSNCSEKIEEDIKTNTLEHGLNTPQIETTSILNSKEPYTNLESQKAMQTSPRLLEIKAEKNDTASSTPVNKHSPLRRHKQSPRRSILAGDLSPRPTSYVCRKCKHHFGRKISFDNHVEMCRGRRRITAPTKSDKKVPVVSPSQGGASRTSVIKEGKETAKKDHQSSHKVTPSLPPNSIGTRSKHRDSSSESQRSASSDTPASVRTRARVTRSLSPERKVQNTSPQSAAKNLNKDKELKRQIASFGNIHDGLRGRARRTVFSKYAKTTSTPERLDQAKQHKDKFIKREGEGSRSSSKNTGNSKKALPMPSDPSISTKETKAQSSHQEGVSKAASKVNSPNSTTGSIQTRHARHTPKLDQLSNSEKGPMVSSDFPTTIAPSFVEFQILSSNHLDHTRDSDLSSSCSAEYSDSDNKDVSLGLRARRGQCQSASETTKKTDIRGTPERKLQQMSTPETPKQTILRTKSDRRLLQKSTPESSKQGGQEKSSEGKLKEKLSPETQKKADKKQASDSPSEEEKASPHQLHSKADSKGGTPNRIGAKATCLEVDSVAFNIEETPENIGTQPVGHSENLINSDVIDERRGVQNHSAQNSTAEGTRKKQWKAPSTDAIDKLMNVIKHSSVKKTTNRGRPLENTGLKLSVANSDSSQLKEDNVSESAVISQPLSLTGSLEGGSLCSKSPALPILLDKVMSSSADESHTSSSTTHINKSDSKLEGTQETMQMKEESAEKLITLPSSNSVVKPSSTLNTSKAEGFRHPCKSLAEEALSSSQTVNLSQEMDLPRDTSLVEKDSDSFVSTEILSASISEIVHPDTDIDLATSVEDISTMECEDMNSVNETMDCASDKTASDGDQEHMDTKSFQSTDEQQAQPFSSRDASKSTICSDKHNPVFDKSPSTQTGAKKTAQEDKSLTSVVSTTISGNQSKLELRSKSKSSKQFSELRSQNKKTKDLKPDVRGRIASRRIKEKHRAFALGQSKTTITKRGDSKTEKKLENISRRQALGLKKKSVNVVDKEECSEGYLGDNSEIEVKNEPCESKSVKKKDKDGSRIKTSANRAYVMRSSAGEKKLECFDKAKIFKYVDVAKTRCLGCGVKYTKMYNLRRHIISNHLKWTRYRCSLCGCEKYDKSHCVRHIKEVHRDQLRDRSLGPVKSLIINLTKQGSQARSVKISHSMKRNQETERKQNESIYARPTLSLRRRGRPTLPLLSSTSLPQNIPADDSEHSPPSARKKLAQDPDKVSPSHQNELHPNMSNLQPESPVTQPEVSQPNSNRTRAVKVNGETEREKVTVPIAKAKVVKAAKAHMKHRYSISGSEELYTSTLECDNQKAECSSENENIFAQLQDPVQSFSCASNSELTNLSRRGLKRTPKVLNKINVEQSSRSSESELKPSVSGARSVPNAEELGNISDHSPIQCANSVSLNNDVSHPLQGKATPSVPPQCVTSNTNHVSELLNPSVMLSSQLTEIIAKTHPEEEEIS